MATTIEKINGVTKRTQGNLIVYYFPLGLVKINGELITVPYDVGFGLNVKFSDLDTASKEGQTNAEDLVDFWTGGKFFFDPSFNDKLDKVQTEAQTVVSDVEFFGEVTIPPSSFELGSGGAKISGAGRNINYKDAFENNKQSAYSTIDASGNTPLIYEDLEPEETITVNSVSGVTLSDPQVVRLPSILDDVLLKEFIVIPKTAGVLRVQIWVGVDDTGSPLVEKKYNVLNSDIDTEFKEVINFQSCLTDDSLFIRFSGVQLSGGMQIPISTPLGDRSGGVVEPFLKSVIHETVLTDVVVKSDLQNEYNDSEAESSTTSPNYQNKVNLTFDSVDGDYIINWTCEVFSEDNGTRIEHKLELDNSIIINETDPNYDTDQKEGFGCSTGFQKRTLTAGSHDLDLGFKTTQAGKEVTIRRARVFLQKLAS